MLFAKLFFEFFKIGLFAVGGGAATIPFLSSLSEKTAWFTKLDLANMIAISESTPGAIGVNMSTYVGFLTGGDGVGAIIGGIVASLGLIAPSIIISIIISGILNRFKENSIVKSAFYGLRPASTGLIAAAAFEVIKIAVVRFDEFIKTKAIVDLIDVKNLIIFTVLFVFMTKTKFHPVLYIAISAIIGVIVRL